MKTIISLTLQIGLFILAALSAQATPDATLADFQARGPYYNGGTNALPYRLFKPDGYDLVANANRSYPLVLFMHGKGDRGTDNAVQITGAGAPVLGLVTGTNRDSFPAFVVCPQIPTTQEWAWGDTNGGIVYDAHHIIELLKTEFRIDTSRIYVTGLSLGGMGCWQQLLDYDNYYAAAVVCSGDGNNVVVQNYVKTPLWVFHGTVDTTFDVSLPRARVSATRGAGGYVVYTEYPAVGHTEAAWGTPGNNHGLCTPGLMQWLTSQVLGQPNASAPIVTITNPTANSNTTATNVNVSGTASDALPGALTRTINSIAWSNNSASNSAVVSGSNWTASSIPLTSGANSIQILATDNQSTTFNARVIVNQVSDGVAPVIGINAPTSSSTYSTTSSTLNLAGTASDNIGVTSLSWSNNRGGSGTTTVAANWSINGITLFNGTNVLTVTAKDAANNAATATLTVTANLPPVNQAPVVSAGANQTISLPSTATLSGTVTDDGVAPGNPTPTSTWSQLSGPASGVATFANANAVATTVSFNFPGTYVLALTGNDGVLHSSANVTITVNPDNSNNPQPIRFDFGGVAEAGTGAITPGNWNNVTTVSTGVKIANAVDSTGAQTGVGLTITTAFNNINYLGSTSASGAYPSTAMQDSFFVQDAQTAAIRLTGLNPSATYTLIFFASRVGGGTNRVTNYTVAGTTVPLDATDNTMNTVGVGNVVPQADGTIDVSLTNAIGSGYGYLGVLEVQPAAAHKTLDVDFGGVAEAGTGAITPGNWNNVTTVDAGLKIANLIDSTGAPTGIGLSITQAFNNINYLGSTSTTGLFPPTAMQDNFFVQDTQIAKVKLQGLSPTRTYTLTFFGCRMGGGTNRVTAYTVGSTTVALDATDNTATAASIPNLVPAADGTLEVSLKNQINSGYGYLGVLEVTW